MTIRRSVAALACIGGAAVLLALALNLGSGGPSARPAVRQGSPKAPRPVPETPLERRLGRALREGVEEAAELGGRVEAAAMLDGAAAPILASSEPGGEQRPMRMWSMSKVATMIAVLRLLGWGQRPGEAPSRELVDALNGALTRSENCRQRRVVLELQHLAGGVQPARDAFAAVFDRAGGRVEPGTQVEAPDALCVPFLETQVETPEPMAPALLLGTSRWRVSDAVRLAHALAIGSYGEELSARVVEFMRAPKQASREAEPGELTAPVGWGAGAVFSGSDPAYKAGWGGALNGNFLAGQIGVVPIAGGDHLALAVIFHPDAQPPRDDPGITAAPAAVETVMGAVRSSTVRSESRERRTSAPASAIGTD